MGSGLREAPVRNSQEIIVGTVNTPRNGVKTLWSGAVRPQARVVEGGYVLLDAACVALFASARSSGMIRPGDVSGLLALAEMGERRKFAAGAVRYAADEFAKVLNLSLRRAQMMLRRLRKAGLIRSQGRSITLVRSIDGHALAPDAARVIDSLGKKKVVIPRPFLRWLCRSEPATVWTAIGHACRALFRHEGGVRTSGTCKASWLASWAPVAERSIKRAREALCSIGWLKRIATPQWMINRSGPLLDVDPCWRAPLAPPDAQGRAPLAPPCLRPALSSENADRAPRLDSPTRKNLEDPAALATLFAQATAAGKVEDTPDGAFRFAALAAKVRRTARNVRHLFRWMLDNPQAPSPADIECARDMAEKIKPRRVVQYGPAPVATVQRTPWTAEERAAFRPQGWTSIEEACLEGIPGTLSGALSALVRRGVDFDRANAISRARFAPMFHVRTVIE